MMTGRSQIVSAPPTNSQLGRIVEHVTDRLQAGQPVDWDALAAEHPAFADELCAIRPTLEALGRLSRAGESAISGMARIVPPDEPCPEALGDFRLIREVGRGGMGIVYEAEQI